MNSRAKISRQAAIRDWKETPLTSGARFDRTSTRTGESRRICVWYDALGRVRRARQEFSNGVAVNVDGGVDDVLYMLNIFGGVPK